MIAVLAILVLASSLTPSRQSDSLRLELVMRGDPALRLDRSFLDFGEVDTSQPVERTFMVTNNSSVDAVVTLSLESIPPFGIRVDWFVADQQPPAFVPRGASVPVVVTVFRTGRDPLGTRVLRLAVASSQAR